MKTLLIITIAAVVLVGCSSEPKQVSGAAFQEYHRLGVSPMHIYEYIGEKNGKFYLRHKSMSLINQRKWNEETLYAEGSELNPTFLEQLRKQSKQFVEQKAEEK